MSKARNSKSPRWFSAKLLLLGALLAVIAGHAPWRLTVIAVETLAMRPGHLRMPGPTENDNYWRAQDLQSHLENMGWTVLYEPNDPRYFGMTRWLDRTIVVNADMSWNAKFATLAHEGAHALQPPRLTQNQSEVFAESVAALVVGPRVRESARYLSSVKADILVIPIFWQEIYRVAAILEP